MNSRWLGLDNVQYLQERFAYPSVIYKMILNYGSKPTSKDRKGGREGRVRSSLPLADRPDSGKLSGIRLVGLSSKRKDGRFRRHGMDVWIKI